MRISLVFDGLTIPAKDGVTYRFLSLCNNLKFMPRDLEFDIYLGDRGWVKEDLVHSAGIRSQIFPAEWLYSNDLSQLADLIRLKKPDILHICNSHSVVLHYGRKLADLLECKLVCDMHDIDADLLRSQDQPRDMVEMAKVQQSLVESMCDASISISPLDHTRLIASSKTPEKIHNVPNGIDEAVKQRLPNTGQKICFIGNMYYPPNAFAAQFIIKNIAPLVLSTYPNAQFVFIGRVPPDLHALSSEQTHFLGPIDDIDSIIGSSAVALAPLFQGSGMKVKILTYASYGIPIIASPIAKMGYEQVDGIFDARTAEEFYEQIASIFADAKMAHLSGIQTQKSILTQFGWEKCVGQLEKVYRFVASNDASHPRRVEFLENTSVVQKLNLDKPLWLQEKRF